MTSEPTYAAFVMRSAFSLAFRYSFLALVAVALMTSCSGDTGSAVPTVSLPAATSVPATTAPPPTRTVSPTATREPVVLPRHDETIPANRGDRYVYGELSLVDDCLRISYVDQVDREGTRHGLLVVWPAGFDVRAGDDALEVTGPDGAVVAAEGQTLRLSGKKVSRQSAAVDQWDWQGGEAGYCAGPFWLVGDEVTAMKPGGLGAKPTDGIHFPRLKHQRGGVASPLEGMEGRLELRGQCLLLEIPHPPWEYLVVWPPGFTVHRKGDDLVVTNGGNSVIAHVGDDVTLGGRSGKTGSDYSDECPGAYFLAYSVHPAGQ